jgi:signal transduction histidine kinase
MRKTLQGISRFELLIAGIVIAAVGSVTWTQQHNSSSAAQQEWELQLASSASARADLIGHWLAEREADAQVLAAYPLVREAVSTGRVNRYDLETIFRTTADLERYQGIELIRAAGAPASGASSGPSAQEVASVNPDVFSPSVRALLLTTARTGVPAIELDDFDPSGHLPEDLVIAVPVASGAGVSQVAHGALALDMDAGQRLFPFVRAAAARGRTQQVLLVNESHGRMQYLSPLRQADAANAHPMRTLWSRPIAGGVVGEFYDYQGVRVFAAIERVPRSPWKLVDQIAVSEALSEYNHVAFFRLVSAVFIVLTFVVVIVAYRNRLQSRGLAERLGQQERMADLEERLLRLQKLEALGRLAAGVAHDFNNLLTVINGTTELLLHEVSPDDPLHAPLAEILKAGEKGSALTHRLLAVGRRQLSFGMEVNLNTAINDTADLLRKLVGDSIVIRTQLDPAAATIQSEPGQIEQILMNLVVNARDAMPDGGEILIATRRVEIAAPDDARRTGLRPGCYTNLSVRDTGQGMSRETQAHIFEPFFTTKPADKGTGLGLATVYAIVQQSGGYITVESEPGRGSEFQLYFPCGAPPRTPARSRQEAKNSNS